MMEKRFLLSATLLSSLLLILYSCGESGNSHSQKTTAGISYHSFRDISKESVAAIISVSPDKLILECDSNNHSENFCHYYWTDNNTINIQGLKGEFPIPAYYSIGISQLQKISLDSFKSKYSEADKKQLQSQIDALINDKSMDADMIIYESNELMMHAKQRSYVPVKEIGSYSVWSEYLNTLFTWVDGTAFRCVVNAGNDKSKNKRAAIRLAMLLLN